ncbi:hypothetical protein D3C75_955990 [compost metagenome]
MNVGDWVFAVHEGNKITGFLAGICDELASVFVTIPQGYGMITMPLKELGSHNEPVVWLDDIPALIDLSLDVRDREWFNQWVYELLLWKPAAAIRDLNVAP